MSEPDPMFTETVESGRAALDQADDRIIAALGQIADLIGGMSDAQRIHAGTILKAAKDHIATVKGLSEAEVKPTQKMLDRLVKLMVEISMGRNMPDSL